MSLGDGDKLNRIEELKNKLFNKNYQTKIEYHNSFPHFQKRDVMDVWGKKEDAELVSKEKFLMKTSIFKKFFIFSIIFFILASGYASFIFFFKGNIVSNDNIGISVLSNAFTAGGEDYSLLLEIVNKNSSPLELVDLIIEYPKGSQGSQNNFVQENEYYRKTLGTIPAGGIKNENTKFVIFGEQGSIRQIKISLEYRVEGSNAIFVKEKLFEVSISSTPINLSVNAPLTANSNQDYTFDIKAALNATKSVSNILLKIDYPLGFQFVKATPEPSVGNNIWNLGDLASGAERSISITGQMIDVFDGEEKVFRVWTGSQSTSDKSSIEIIFNSLEHVVMIQKPSINATLLINGISEREYAVDTKTAIQGQIQWINNLETNINDLEITAKISGNAVNRNTITTEQGFYNSLEDLIIWDKNSISKFKEIGPGDTGVVSFSLSSLPLFSSLGGLLLSPSINIDVSITGKQSKNNNIITELSSKKSKIIRIISDIGLSSKAFYYFGSFKNTGPIPPKVEQKTTYTVIWSLSNTANNISKAQIRSSIPAWVRFVGTFSPVAEDLTYDSLTREIIWNVGSILKGTGISEAKREVSFQIEFTPSLSQIGTAPIILNDTTLTGYDDFALVNIKVNKTSLDTKLLSDSPPSPNGGRVVE